MNGVWKIDIRYFKKPTSRSCTAIGFLMPDDQVERNSNSMVMAFDMAFREIRTKLLKKGA